MTTTEANSATYHAVQLEQCSLFGADVGPSIEKAMTDAAAYLRSLAAPAPELDADQAWQELCEKDDRTSPGDHPNHALITRDELAAFMRAPPAPVTASAVDALLKAEAFISGFEDDELQEGVPDLLKEIRSAIKRESPRAKKGAKTGAKKQGLESWTPAPVFLR